MNIRTSCLATTFLKGRTVRNDVLSGAGLKKFCYSLLNCLSWDMKRTMFDLVFLKCLIYFKVGQTRCCWSCCLLLCIVRSRCDSCICHEPTDFIWSCPLMIFSLIDWKYAYLLSPIVCRTYGEREKYYFHVGFEPTIIFHFYFVIRSHKHMYPISLIIKTFCSLAVNSSESIGMFISLIMLKRINKTLEHSNLSWSSFFTGIIDLLCRSFPKFLNVILS